MDRLVVASEQETCAYISLQEASESQSHCIDQRHCADNANKYCEAGLSYDDIILIKYYKINYKDISFSSGISMSFAESTGVRLFGLLPIVATRRKGSSTDFLRVAEDAVADRLSVVFDAAAKAWPSSDFDSRCIASWSCSGVLKSGAGGPSGR